MSVEVYYFCTGTNKSPVKDFIESLDIGTQIKFFAKKSLLECYEYKLPEPHAKHIGDGIFELRFVGIEGKIRILYFFFHQNRAILTNGFVKKRDKTPRNEIKIAIERRKIYLKSLK